MKHIRLLVTVICLFAFVGLMFSSCAKLPFASILKDSYSQSSMQDESVNSSVESNTQSSASQPYVSDVETSDDISDTSEATAVFAEVDINYLAFGDSISRGCMLPSPEEQCYPKKLALMIDELNGEKSVEYQNFSVDGQQSEELLELLATKTDEIKKADVISISIGANNILSTMTEKTKKIMENNGLALSDIYQSGKIFEDIFSGKADTSLYANVYNTFNEINAYIYGPAFQIEIGKAAARLNSDLASIIELIRENNPNTIIVINTVYNPYKDFQISIGSTTVFNSSDIVDQAVSALNMVITNNASELGYKVADVYYAFENYDGDERLVNAFFDFSELLDTNFDIHPSEYGQKVIAETVLESIKESITENFAPDNT